MRALGCDVSYWNGPNQQFPKGVDWKRARAEAGIVFAFARANHGERYTDPTFQQHWYAMLEAGVLRAAYCYFVPNQNPLEEAALLYRLTQGEGELPDVIDVETDGGLRRPRLRTAVKRCLDEYERLSGRKPMIYTRASWWDRFIGVAGWESDYLLWVAHYKAESPAVPKAWKDAGWRFWQDSDRQTFPGFQDPTVDRDFFNGTEAELLEWLGRGTVPVTLEVRINDLERSLADLQQRLAGLEGKTTANGA